MQRESRCGGRSRRGREVAGTARGSRFAVIRMLLENKIAIITGASRGIGRAIAAAFAREGATCYICGRKQETLEQVARELGGLPGRIVPHACHVGKTEDLERAGGYGHARFRAASISW